MIEIISFHKEIQQFTKLFSYFWKIFITPFVLGSLKERINSR